MMMCRCDYKNDDFDDLNDENDVLLYLFICNKNSHLYFIFHFLMIP